MTISAKEAERMREAQKVEQREALRRDDGAPKRGMGPREAARLKLACRLVAQLVAGVVPDENGASSFFSHNIWGDRHGYDFEPEDAQPCGCELCSIARVAFPTRDEWQLIQGIVG